MNSPDYPKILKENLGKKYSPAVLFVKGNIKLLNMNSISIVGSRDASEKALQFTDNVAKLAAGMDTVVISGYARGVDSQVLILH